MDLNTFLHEYEHILTDPAHLAVEVTLMLLIDVIFLSVVWPLLSRLMRRAIFKEHLTIDAEHGVEHTEDGELVWTFR